MATAWLVLTGTQIVRQVSDLARFGAILFQILAPLQFGLATVFAALSTANAVCQEKDRRTLLLLLMTRLTRWELVVGKLLGSLLSVLVHLAAAVPVFLMIGLFGGVSYGQIGRVFAVTLATVVLAGSLGATVAFWREKTFQTLALTSLLLVFWLVAWEIVAARSIPVGLGRSVPVFFSPWQALLEAMRPQLAAGPGLGVLTESVGVFLLLAFAGTALLNGLAICFVRSWNSDSRVRVPADPEQLAPADPVEWSGGGVTSGTVSPSSVPGESRDAGLGLKAPEQDPIRAVWDNPVLWREVCTWAYGRRVLLIRAIYLLLFFTAVGLLAWSGDPMAWRTSGRTLVSAEARTLIPLLVVSLVLVNALAVTSLTTERDGQAIDLLLVTDLTPGEFLFGKLGGVLFNAKEMVVLPMLLLAGLWFADRLSGENLLYVIGGLVVINLFVAVLGIHIGMAYSSSRTAIGVSLGTVLFLLLGVATCMRMMIAFSGSFQVQFQPFVACMLGGGIALYYALGHRNPSTAIGLTSFLAPMATFHAITSFMIGKPGAVFVVTAGTYGFATAAMLVPALYEFDVATGRGE